MLVTNLTGKTSSEVIFVKDHFKEHKEDKPYKCDTRGRKFVLISDLKTHLKKHNGNPS